MYIMPDYSKAVIYKIETGDDLYIGSTCNFTQRKYYHNRAVNFKGSHCNAKVYNTIRENGGEWKITPIKEFPCESKLQLTIEEEKCRKELGATLNTYSCGTGIEMNGNKKHYDKQYGKQYREQNKEKISEKSKKYYENNKQKICERQNQKIEYPICGSLVTYTHMARHQRRKICKATALQMEHNH